MDYLDAVLAGIGKLIFVGGGAAAITFGLLRAFGTNWLDTYFHRRKKEFEHEQNVAIAELKRTHDEALKDVQALIDKDMHRARKLYDREFDVLTEALELLARAFDAAEKFVGDLVPAIHLMSEAQRAAVFEADDLSAWQIEDILSYADDEMLDRYIKVRRHRRYVSALEDGRALLRCIALKNVFMADGLKERFQNLHGMINAALIEQKVAFDYPAHAKYEAHMALLEDGKMQYAELEALVRERLWSVE